MIVGAPWYTSESNIHSDFNIPVVTDIIKESTIRYATKVLSPPIRFSQSLASTEKHTRLKRIVTTRSINSKVNSSKVIYICGHAQVFTKNSTDKTDKMKRGEDKSTVLDNDSDNSDE